MRRRKNFSIFVFTFVAVLIAGQFCVRAQTPAPSAGKELSKDEVFFSIARRINTISESPVSAVVAEVDGVIEIVSITKEADGKALVTVKERTPSSASYTNKSTRLRFSPPPAGDQWVWGEFEDNRKFYPVDKLFPYTKDELGKRKQMAVTKWNALITAISKQGDAGNKVLETAKAIIKSDPPPLATLTNIRNTLNQALKDNDKDGIINAYRELSQQTEPITTLAETYSDLKANDAYLRLLEEYKNAVNLTNAARKDYVQTVEAYNEALLRLPFALVAYGMQFTKIEANLTTD